MINIALCDDNKAFLSILSEMVKRCLSEYNIKYNISDYLSGKVFLEHHKKTPFDVVFLDILLPDSGGFEIAKEIKAVSPGTHIIFVTTESSLVYDSFDFRPFYFVPKDSIELLYPKLHHVIKLLISHLSAHTPICIEMPYGEKKYVEPVKIISVQSKANYLYYSMIGADRLCVRGTMDSAMKDLSADFFVRIHNRNIVNMANIRKVDYPNNRVIMCDGREISISRTYKKEFDDIYTKYLRDYS